MRRWLVIILIFAWVFFGFSQSFSIKHCFRACPGKSLHIGQLVVMDSLGCLRPADSLEWPIAGVIVSYEVDSSGTLWCPFNKGILFAPLDSSVKPGDMLTVGKGGKVIKKNSGNITVGVAFEGGDGIDNSLERFGFLGYQDFKAPTIVISKYPDLSGDVVCYGPDDSPQIKSAIISLSRCGGGVIYFRQGEYTLSNSIVDIDTVVDTTGERIDTVIIKDITITGGAGTKITLNNIVFHKVFHLVLDNLFFTTSGAFSSINLGKNCFAKNVVITNCTFEKIGVNIYHCAGAIISGNTFVDLSFHHAEAIHIESEIDTTMGYSVLVRDNTFLRCYNGIIVQDVSRVYIRNNYISGLSFSSENGIKLIRTSECVVTNNFITNFLFGIRISSLPSGAKDGNQSNQAVYNVIAFNTIDNCFSLPTSRGANIYLHGGESYPCAHTFIYGNRGFSDDTAVVGIWFEDADSNFAFNNIWRVPSPYCIDSNSVDNAVVGPARQEREMGYWYSIANFPENHDFRPYEITIWNEKYNDTSYTIKIDRTLWQSGIIDFTATNVWGQTCCGQVMVTSDRYGHHNLCIMPDTLVYSEPEDSSHELEITSSLSGDTINVIFQWRRQVSDSTWTSMPFNLGHSVRKFPRLKTPSP